MSAPVSVVVPTRDRAAALARCLAALAGDRSPAVELIVVDDGSRDRGGVAAAAAQVPGARVIRAAGQGPAAARNLGVRAATGEVVCFLDDDCEPRPRWASRLAAAVEPTGIAAGHTESPEDASALVRASQHVAGFPMLAGLDQRRGMVEFAPSCNLAVRRSIALEIPFDHTYPHAAAEDRDWCARALAAGHRIRYEPAAGVVHRQLLDSRAFARQQYRYGQGAARFRAASSERRLAPARFYLDLVGTGFRQGASVGAAVLAAQGLTLAGALSERARAATRR